MMAIRLQKALPRASRDVLRSKRRALSHEYDGVAYAQVHCSRPDGESAGEREILLSHNGEGAETTIVHPNAHAGQGDQAGQRDRRA